MTVCSVIITIKISAPSETRFIYSNGKADGGGAAAAAVVVAAQKYKTRTFCYEPVE